MTHRPPLVPAFLIFATFLGMATSCPKPPPVIPPKPETAPRAPSEPEPPPVKRPTPPEDTGAVPDVPPPVKP
jgi:hypothetical protein